MAKVLVGIPVRARHGQPCYKTQVCLEMLKKQTNHAVEIFIAGGQQISQNSLTICNKMLDENWDYLLYTGDDIVFPPWSLDRLMAHDKDFVSGVCTWKSPPFLVPVMKVDPEDDKAKHILIRPEHVQNEALLEVDGVGSGFILVKRRVFEKVAEFMRDRVYSKFGEDEDTRFFAPIPFFGVTCDATTGSVMGSDYLFSKQCKLAGVEIFLDCGLILRHRWEGEYDITHHWDWLAKYGGNYNEEKFFGDLPAFTPFDSESIYWGPAGPPVDINVTSTGNVYHAENHVAPILGGRLEDITAEEKPPTGVGYVVGWHVDSEESWQLYSAWAARFSTVFVHWVGSDILSIPKWMDSADKVAHMNHPRFIHFVEEDRLVPELKPYFENIHVCPIPTMSAFPIAPLPKKFTVAIYYPKHRHDFHYGDVMEEVVKAMPDTQFNFYHLFGEKPDFEYPNMAWLGSLEPQQYHEMLKRSSCMLRLSKHDGRPFSIVEAAIMGRRFITNYEMPFSKQVGSEPSVQEVVDQLRKIETETGPDEAAADYYLKENDFKTYKDKIRSLMGAPVTAIGGYEYRSYWESRWNDDTAGVKPDLKTNEFVNGEIVRLIAEHSCKSILDLGCGSMKRWEELPIEADGYVGVDVSAKAIRMAAKKYPDSTFFVADITADTLPQKDLVIATEVLPHIKPEHFKNTIKKLSKCAKKAAIFSLTFESKGGGYQNEVPPVDEWRLGKGWTAKRIKTPTESTIELVILTRETVLANIQE